MADPYRPRVPKTPTYPRTNPYTASQDIDASTQVPNGLNMTYDLYADVPAHILYLKDSIAGSKKKSSKYQDMFAPENLALNSEEYNVALNEKQVAPATNQVLTQTAHLDDSGFIDRLNKLRELSGQMPLPPEDPILQDPNVMQSLAAALGAILTPEFAFDQMAVPYQHQLNEQAKEAQKNERLYQIELDKFNKMFQLGVAEFEGLNDREMSRYDADFKREIFEKGNAFNAGESQKGRDFQQSIFNQETQRTFNILEKEQKFSLAMQWVQMATNPTVGPEARQAAANTLKGLGINVEAFAGKTLAEQNIELENQLKGLDIKFAEGTLEARIGQESVKWQTGLKQNILLDKEIKWFDQKAKAEIDSARANIANIHSLIQDRRFQQNFQLTEQQRAYLGGVQENILGSIRAFGSQIEANNTRINNINTQLSKAGIDDAEKKALEAERSTLIKQNEALATQSGAMQNQLDGFNEYFIERSGAAMGPTGLGETYLGVPYEWGGKDKDGIDCSGLTYRVALQDFGIKLPHGAKYQWEYAKKSGAVVDLSDPNNLKEGDFCYFSDGSGWHTGIVIFKNGVPYLRNAPSTGQVVSDKPLEIYLKGSKKLVGAARFWKEEKSPETEKLDPQGGMPMRGK